MAGVRKPKFPRGSTSHRPGPGQGSLFPDAVPDVPPVRRVKSIPVEHQDRSKAVSGRQRATPPPVRAVQPRGSRLGRHYELGEEPEEGVVPGFPLIDPTSTSDPSRPRTLQAGYDPKTQTLRVRFRDGTPWEYLNVPPVVWRNFKRVKSPGRFINRVLNNYDYQRGDF